MNFKSTPLCLASTLQTRFFDTHSKRTEIILNSGFISGPRKYSQACTSNLGGDPEPTQLYTPTQHTTIHHSFNWVHRFNSALTVIDALILISSNIAIASQRHSYHAEILCLRSSSFIFSYQRIKCFAVAEEVVVMQAEAEEAGKKASTVPNHALLSVATETAIHSHQRPR